MKKKKIRILLFVMLFGIFFKMNSVQAVIYNGDANNMGSGSSNGKCNFSGPKDLCPWANSSTQTVRISIWFINNGKFVKEKGYVYWTTNSNYIGKEGITKFKSPPLKAGSTTERVFKAGDSWTTINKNIIDYFGVTKQAYIKEPSEQMKAFFEELMGSNWKEQFDGEGQIKDSVIVSQPQNKEKPATYGYRIIIEPALNYRVYTVNEKGVGEETSEILTVKEIAKKVANEGYHNMCTIGGIGVCKFAFGGTNVGETGYAAALTVDFKDVGITKGTANAYKSENKDASTSCKVVDEKEKANFYKEVAKDTNGCGYNIIDITNYTESYQCYSRKVIDGEIECVNTDQNNTATYSEIFEKYTCTKEEYQVSTTSEHGEKIGETQNCTLYCKESAFLSLPGNVSGTLKLEAKPQVGNYFTWPSIKENGMKMLMRNTLTCKIVQKNDTKCTATEIQTLKNKGLNKIKNSKLSATLTGGTTRKINDGLVTYSDVNDYYSKSNYNKQLQFKDGVSDSFDFVKEAYFKIPNNINRLYNRETDKVFDGTIAAKGIYDRGEGVISVSSKDDTKKTYELSLSNINVGTDNKFGKLISDYTCDYTITPTSSCVCPEGTLKAGTDLYEKLTENKTCSELQATECDICECPPESDYPEQELLVGEDPDSKACKAKQEEVCYDYDDYCEYDGKKIDVTGCMKTQQEYNGMEKEEAYLYCKHKLCPYCIDKKGAKVDLTSCLEQGNTYYICEALYCPDYICELNDCYECSVNCKWRLYSKTNASMTYKKSCDDGKNCGEIKLACPGGTEKMNNAEGCLTNKLGKKLQGQSIDAALTKGLITETDVQMAFAACEPEVCPTGNGEKIIYRQIDLSHPFPGKNNKGTITGLSLTSLKSRKPGDNWNSKLVVTSKILKARGVSGYELYNKDPLYIIKLTPQTIKKIREYNKKNEYNDFNLTCTNENKTASCISDFLHKDGTVANLSLNDFILKSYGTKRSVDECYSMKYSESSFNSCYKKDN